MAPEADAKPAPAEEERPYIRPSSLQLAELCSLSPWLANRYREENDNMRFGKDRDADISAALQEGREPVTAEGKLLIAWLRARFSPDAKYFVQRKVQLWDPVTGALITQGTPDLLVMDGRRLFIVDWKTKGQMYSGKLAAPDNNLQQQAYLVAAGMEFDAEDAQIVLACFDLRGVVALEGEVLTAGQWWPLIDRIKAIPPIDFAGPQPVAIKGEHCDACYQKGHCTAYLLPAMAEAPTELVPFTETKGLITREDAIAGLEWLDGADRAIGAAKKIRDLVKDQIDTFVSTRGEIEKDGMVYGPIPTNGSRKAPTVGELEELGLPNLIKAGTPGVKFDWKKAPDAAAKAKRKGKAA